MMLYVVLEEGAVNAHMGQALPLESAVRYARNLTKAHGRRMNIYKLTQTHTYKTAVCRECGELPATGGELVD